MNQSDSIVVDQTRTCSYCKTEKSITEFSKGQYDCKTCAKTRRELRKQNDPEYFKRSLEKHIELNTDKIKEYRKNYRVSYYQNNIEKLREYGLNYYNNNKESCLERRANYYSNNKEACVNQSKTWLDGNKEYLQEYRKQYQIDNLYQIRERNRLDRLNNPEKYRERSRKRYENNKEYFNIAWHKRRARLANAEGSYTKEDIDFLFESQKGKCPICNRSIKNGYHIDHKTPLSKGGSNNKENLQLTCASCNTSKGSKDEIEFMQSRGFLF